MENKIKELIEKHEKRRVFAGNIWGMKSIPATHEEDTINDLRSLLKLYQSQENKIKEAYRKGWDDHLKESGGI